MMNDEQIVPYPYGRTIGLPGKISEVDRAFFSVLKMDFSLHCMPAELGYYYKCTFEKHFSMERFEAASEHFHYFRRNPHKFQLLTAEKKVLVKHIDLRQVAASTDLSRKQLHDLLGGLKREFDFLCRVSAKEAAKGGVSSGLVDVFMILSRSSLQMYLFLERPEETLDEYLRRTASSLLALLPPPAEETESVWVKKSDHWKPNEKHIPLAEARLVVRKLAQTVLHFHRQGLVHGALAPRAVFLFRDSSAEFATVKLANFAFAARTESEALRAREVSALQSLAIEVAENTAYASAEQREVFYAAITLLTRDDQQQEDQRASSKAQLQRFVEALKSNW